MSPLSVSDLAAAGIGFEIAGAIALARGLYRSPEHVSRHIAIARNTFAAFRVAEAEDRADAEVGIGFLILGFTIQALAYALTAEGVRSSSTVDGAADVSLLCSLACAGVGYAIARYARPRRTKRFLVTLARYDTTGVRHDSPLLRELITYGELLDYEMTRAEMENEDAQQGFVQRVFGVEHARLR